MMLPKAAYSRHACLDVHVLTSQRSGELIQGCHVGAGEVLATADSASKQELADVQQDLAILKIQFWSAQQPKTYVSGTELGRGIRDTPSFRKAATASELPSSPAPERWTAFLMRWACQSSQTQLIGSSSYANLMLGAAESARLMAGLAMHPAHLPLPLSQCLARGEGAASSGLYHPDAGISQQD